VGSCNGEYFDETLSFGLDAGIALGTVDLRTRIHMGGTPLYLASGVNQLLFHLDSYHFQATLDGGREIGGETPMIAVQLGPTYGGGFRICPDAKLDDGLFDLCWADTASLPRAISIFLRAKNGKHVNCPEIHFERASSIHLEFDRRPPVQMDGEAHIAESYDIRLHPHALEVLAPALT
jgi:diacylglycerol kinase family enzyme